ncbi:conserved hypothetical protein [Streptomyces sviceus ATCC 29083]|uniref:Uncharacterized protein n=1 Tax=Streptomyces sviceus (strain ATCC 29083 / DSM 924 / JCM 4929 / NBRC 13980 / NCIMB 11184 / NRRL 5439 / UC 5370) TaxID=463191 RepID=B5HSS1_STRX2|nr:conserved hypothetical protein [Streptomyces sviceus ATCC 29083]
MGAEVESGYVRITPAREAADTEGVPLFVNARVDTFWRGANGVDPGAGRRLPRRGR